MRSILPIFMLVSACAGGDGDDVATSPCMEETRAGTLQVGDRFEGEALSIDVVSMDPSPPEVGLNDWVLELEGAEGCAVEVEPRMPDHGHGADAGTSTLDAGELTVESLEISMGGVWEVRVTATCADDEVKEAVLSLCVDA